MKKALGRLLPRGALLAALLAFAAPAARAQLAFWSDANYSTPLLSRSPLYGTVMINSLWMPPASMPEALAWSPATGDLLFGEGSWTGARIRKTNPGFIAPVTLVDGQSCVRGLAADAVTGTVYWTSSNLVIGSRVYRCDPDGGNVGVLLDLGGSANLRGIAVDAAAGWIYFADFDAGVIRRLKTDGSLLQNFLTLGSNTGPWGLTFDPADRRLFWCEYASGAVKEIRVDGTGLTTLYAGRVNPTNIAYQPAAGVPGGGYLIWSEAAAGAPKMMLGTTGSAGPYVTAYPSTAYGGIVFTPGGTLDAGLPFLPAALALGPAAPNPVTSASAIDFSLPSEQHARLELVDVQGRRVASLVDGTLPAGNHHVSLGQAWAAHRPAAGVYFVRLVADGRQLVRKLVVAQ